MSLRTARLDTRATTLVLVADGDHVPTVFHFGARLADDFDIEAAHRLRIAPWLASVPDPGPGADEPPAPSLFPEHGAGFFGQPALLGSRGERDFTTAFALEAIEPKSGALTIRLNDRLARLSVQIELALDAHASVLTAHTTLTNEGDAPYDVAWLAALALPFPADFVEAMTLGGRWAREFQRERHFLGQPCQIERVSRYGRTGHSSSPTLFVGEPGFSDTAGRVIGLHLAWSGNHRVVAEVQRDGMRQAQLGEWLAPGELSLAPDESVETPTVFAAHSAEGLNGVSAAFHAHLRAAHLPRSVAARPRPVVLNTWEAVYFAHDVDTLKAIASDAAALGVERFVLDDGWFGARDADTSHLGDWTVDPRKYPAGLTPLIDHVTALGMSFGLWVEPEMVSPDSDLHRRHPDWCLHTEGRPRPTQRNQLVLDLTRPEVADAILSQLDALLSANAISFLKWDHNRDLAPASSRGRPAARRQTQAVYALIDRLRAAHPEVEIESCAGGGGRADYGIFARAERFWTSDNNDAFERLTIQRGASLLFPLEVMGAHVGAAPSHQTGRTTSLAFRARTALFGHFGLELDPRHLSPDAREELGVHIATYKRFRGLLHTGRLMRFSLGDPQSFGQIVIAEDGGEALAQLVRRDLAPFSHAPPVRLPGLEPSARYRLELVEPWPQPAAATLARPQDWRAGPIASGEGLALIGLALPLALPETIWLVHLTRL